MVSIKHGQCVENGLKWVFFQHQVNEMNEQLSFKIGKNCLEYILYKVCRKSSGTELQSKVEDPFNVGMFYKLTSAFGTCIPKCNT